MNRSVGEPVGRRQFHKIRETEISALLAHSYQRFLEIALLGLPDGMISLIVYHKKLDRKPVVTDSLQLLNIHLQASLAGNADHRFSPGSDTYALRAGKAEAHGRGVGIGDKPLSLFHAESLASRNTGGSHADHQVLSLSHGFRKFFIKSIDIGTAFLCRLIVFLRHHRIFFFPEAALPDPVFAFKQRIFRRSPSFSGGFLKFPDQFPRVPAHGKAYMKAGLL